MASASAHAYLNLSSPADGATMNDAPHEVRLAFSESIVLGATSLDLVDRNGRHFTPTHLRVVASGPDAGIEDPVELVADLPPLPDSAYRLSWRTLSRDDLHLTRGVIVFGIREPVSAAGQTEPAPNIAEAFQRWLIFTGFALAVGGLLAERLYRRGGSAHALPRRAGRLALLGAALATTAAGLLLADQVHAAGVSITDVLSGRYGAGWTIREIGLVGLTAIAFKNAKSTARGSWFPTATACAVLAVAAGNALVGHGGGDGPTHVVAAAAHVSAAALWLGGLACLLLAGLPSLASPIGRASVRSAFVSFARPAALSAAVLVASGVYLASGVAGSADALLETRYGRVLLVKVGLFGLALLLGLRNHRSVRARSRPIPVRTIAVEASVGLAILALAAVLTSSQPATESQFLRPVAASAAPVLDVAAADLQQTLAIRPNLPGSTVIVLEIFNTRRPAPAPVTNVLVSLREPAGRTGAAVAAQQSPDGRWIAPITLMNAGANELQVTVRRPGLPDVTSRFDWNVRSLAAGQRPVLVSDVPIATALREIGLALMLGVCGSCLAVALRRRRKPSSAWRSQADGQASERYAPETQRVGAGSGNE